MNQACDKQMSTLGLGVFLSAFSVSPVACFSRLAAHNHTGAP
jgi:hypothetical protein